MATMAKVTIDGTVFTVPDTFSDISLNDYLRAHLFMTGTKVLCREGGCGACVVYAEYPDPAGGDGLVQRGINSCLCPVLSCDGWSITTVEGIGNRKLPHQIQQRLTDNYGSQCGYCTPGMVMNMYSLTKQYPGQTLTPQIVENSFDGNICRCTGYRPILTAFKSLTVEDRKRRTSADIEDLAPKVCARTGTLCVGRCTDHHGTEVDSPPLARTLHGLPWYQPKTLNELYALMDKLNGRKVFFVAGHTSVGVYRDGPWDCHVDLKKVPDLHVKSREAQGVVIGSGLSLTDTIEFFESCSTESGFEYLAKLAKHFKRVANVPVRNAGTWAGNLLIKHAHNKFPSDLFLCFELAQASLAITDGRTTKKLKVLEFLKTTMNSPLRILLEASFPPAPDVLFRTYKIMPRSQNAHALVNAGFAAKITKQQRGKFIFQERPSLVFGNINGLFVHAIRTEDFLSGKDIGDIAVLQNALKILSQEVNPDPDPVEPSPIYRINLSCALFYKFALEILGAAADVRYRTAVGSLIDERKISSGRQTYPTNKANYPLTQPIPKLESLVQCTGEAKFISDEDSATMLHAAFVLSEQANADILKIDGTSALKVPGVLRIVTAMDIPGVNNFNAVWGTPEELLATRNSLYAGQPVAIVVASSRAAAERGAELVDVTFSNVGKPILTCLDAIASKSFYPSVPDLVIGNAKKAIDAAPNKLQGSLEIGGQFHFHMETQVAICYPTEDGMNVLSGTQWLDAVQGAVSQVLGLEKNKINASVKRLGGAFGAKATRSCIVAAGAALAAYVTNKPVKLHMSLWDNTRVVGKRAPYYTEYNVGFEDDGKLAGVTIKAYANCGASGNDSPVSGLSTWADNSSTEGIYFIEYMMERIAKFLNKSPVDVKRTNYYKNGDLQITGQPISYCSIADVTTQLLQTSEYQKRVQDVAVFNQNNRWRKKGIAVVPMKYAATWSGSNYNCLVAVYHSGGSIAITHGGVEMGQGINTKVAQVVAFELGVPLETISVKETSVITNANAFPTAGSMTSELVCMAALDCCGKLKSQIQPVHEKMPGSPWKDVIEKCYEEGIDLSARSWVAPQSPSGPITYNTYGVTCAEVELDVLTGEHEISRYDVLYDCGDSISPLVDIGQIEGAIVMGLGYYTSEELRNDEKSGKLLTYSTWNYKPPTTKDIPVQFNIGVLKNAPNPLGVLRSKLVAEPPLCMTSAVVFALRNACNAALDERKKGDWFDFDAPMTVERLQGYCGLDISQFTYK